jgi:hypothetical protein
LDPGEAAAYGGSEAEENGGRKFGGRAEPEVEGPQDVAAAVGRPQNRETQVCPREQSFFGYSFLFIFNRAILQMV